MSLPQPPGPPLLFGQNQWRWITNALQSIYAAQYAQATKLIDIQTSLEHLMTQSDNLNAGMAQLSSDLESVALAIQGEIQQLADAVASGADGVALKTAADNAIAGLSAAHGQLTALQGSLAADDATP